MIGGGVASAADTAAVPDEIRILELEPTGVSARDELTPPPSPPTPPYEPTLPEDIPDHTPALDSEPTPQPPQSSAREQRKVPAPTERMVTRSSRESGDAFVTTDTGVAQRAVSATASIHSVDEVLQRHRDEMNNCNTANISVKEAFRTRGDEVKRVIVSNRCWTKGYGCQ